MVYPENGDCLEMQKQTHILVAGTRGNDWGGNREIQGD